MVTMAMMLMVTRTVVVVVMNDDGDDDARADQDVNHSDRLKVRTMIT